MSHGYKRKMNTIEFMTKKYENYIKIKTSENVLKYLSVFGNKHRGFKIEI